MAVVVSREVYMSRSPCDVRLHLACSFELFVVAWQHLAERQREQFMVCLTSGLQVRRKACQQAVESSGIDAADPT
jgi:hypothetical protein